MRLYWRIITENQKNKRKAEVLAQWILTELEASRIHKIEKYYKFDNSFCIDIEQELKVEDFRSGIAETVIQVEKIAMPWNWLNLINDESFELIFNKDENSRFNRDKFNAIRWISASLNENDF